MKNVTFTLLPQGHKQMRVSERLHIHFCPTLTLLCDLRDTFWRLTLNEPSHSAFWWPLANETETLIENLIPDFSI